MVGQEVRHRQSGGNQRQWNQGQRNFGSDNRGKQDFSNQRKFNKGDDRKTYNKSAGSDSINKSRQVSNKQEPSKTNKEKEADNTRNDEVQETNEAKKFTGRSRLFIGNLPNELTEAEFKKLFNDHGEISEVYLNTQRSFGFVRLVSIIRLIKLFTILILL